MSNYPITKTAIVVAMISQALIGIFSVIDNNADLILYALVVNTLNIIIHLFGEIIND